MFANRLDLVGIGIKVVTKDLSLVQVRFIKRLETCDLWK